MPKTIYLGDVAAKVSYPDTRFEALQIADHEQEHLVVLQAICTVPDTFSEGNVFQVCRVRVVDAYYETEAEALSVIRDLVHYLACHEADEKIEVNGVKVFNPHESTFGVKSQFV